MSEKNKIRLQELSHKWLTGMLTKAEQEEFDHWFNDQSELPLHVPANFAQSKGAHEQILLNRIKAAVGISKKQRILSIWPRIAAAASIILVAGTGFYFYQQSKKQEQTLTFAKADIKPGGNKAILTLSDGKKISLSDANLGQIAAQSGVSITKTANGQLVYNASGANDVKVPDYNTIEAPAGGQWQVRLPDGSMVLLNALSSITYPTRFIGHERRIKMNGEAYFEIAHNKAMPFKVISQGQTVEVLGTHFNITAYADEKVIKTTLLEGSVKISDHGRNELLKPGQQAEVTAAKIKVRNDVDLEDVMAWKNGYFKFNENLQSIMNKVARWYDVEVVYDFTPDPALTFSGKILRNKNITSVLNIMELTGNVHFKIEGRRVTVMK